MKQATFPHHEYTVLFNVWLYYGVVLNICDRDCSPWATYNKLFYTINISIPMRPYNDEARFNLTLLFLSQLLLRPNFQEESTESTQRLGTVKPLHNMTHNPKNTAYLQCKMEKYCFSRKWPRNLLKAQQLLWSAQNYLQYNSCLLSCKIPGIYSTT